MAPLIPRDWQLDTVAARIWPHIAAVVSVRNWMVKRGQAWAIAGPCGCVDLVLGESTTRREVEDWAVVFLRADGVSTPPDHRNPRACLGWVEYRALDVGRVPCDPRTPDDPAHGHAAPRVPPRERQGWITAASSAWPLLPQPLIVRDLDDGQRWLCPDPASIAAGLDDSWPSVVPGEFPATADVLLNLVRDLGLVPETLPRNLIEWLLHDLQLGPLPQRELIRLLRRGRSPQPPKAQWNSDERAVIRRVIREARSVYMPRLLPSDFERGPDGRVELDGLPPDRWIATVLGRASIRSDSASNGVNGFRSSGMPRAPF